METLPAWAATLGGILAIAIPALLAWLSKRKEEEEENERKIETPTITDDDARLRDLIRERMRNSSKTSTKS